MEASLSVRAADQADPGPQCVNGRGKMHWITHRLALQMNAKSRVRSSGQFVVLGVPHAQG